MSRSVREISGDEAWQHLNIVNAVVAGAHGALTSQLKIGDSSALVMIINMASGHLARLDRAAVAEHLRAHADFLMGDENGDAEARSRRAQMALFKAEDLRDAEPDGAA